MSGLMARVPRRYDKGKSLSLTKTDRIMLNQARAILTHSRELAMDVLQGGMPFSKAHDEAQRANQGRLSNAFRLKELRRLLPEVAAQVEDGSLTLAEGTSELQER